MSVWSRFAGRLGVVALAVVAGVAVGAAVVHQTVAGELSGAALTQVRVALGAVVGVTVLGAVLVTALGRSAARDLRTVDEAGRSLEADAGSLPTGRADEVGDAARAMERLAEETARVRTEYGEREDETAAELRRLREQADDFAGTMGVAAAGDMTARLDPETEDESMAAVADSFNRMMDEMEGLLAESRTFASEVTERSREAQVATTEIRNASRQVSQSVQRIADGADEQDARMDAVSESITDLSSTTEEAASMADDVTEMADETATRGLDGREQAQAALAGIIQIREATETTVEAIERITDRTDEVSELVEVVEKIATRTNKLALNANIEATRAGGDGDGGGEGFEVIAREVKELAGDAQQELAAVEERIDRIEHDTHRATDDIRSAVDGMESHADAINDTIEALDEVASMASDTNKEVKEIHRMSRDQAEAAESVAAEVQEVNGISAETSEAAERAAAAAEEQTAAADGIVDLTDDLVDRAASLEDRLSEFNITSDAPDVPVVSQVDASGLSEKVGLDVPGEGDGEGSVVSEDSEADDEDAPAIPEAAMGDLFGFAEAERERAADDLVFVDGQLADPAELDLESGTDPEAVTGDEAADDTDPADATGQDPDDGESDDPVDGGDDSKTTSDPHPRGNARADAGRSTED